MFKNVWVNYYLNLLPGSTMSKSSIFLDISLGFFFCVAYLIIGSIFKVEFQNSTQGLITAYIAARLLSPLPLVFFAPALKTTSKRLIKAAYIGILPSFIFFFMVKAFPAAAAFDPFEFIIKWNENNTDKALHLLYSIGIYFIIYAIVNILIKNVNLAFMLATILTLLLGIYKEYRDYLKNKKFDFTDLLYDSLGVFLAFIFLKFLLA